MRSSANGTNAWSVVPPELGCLTKNPVVMQREASLTHLVSSQLSAWPIVS